jgi:hypothetical protein
MKYFHTWLEQLRNYFLSDTIPLEQLIDEDVTQSSQGTKLSQGNENLAM